MWFVFVSILFWVSDTSTNFNTVPELFYIKRYFYIWVQQRESLLFSFAGIPNQMRGSQEEIRANGWETLRFMTCNQWNRNFEIQSLAMRNEGKIMQEFLEVVKLESWKTRIAEGHVSCAKAARSIQGSCRSALRLVRSTPFHSLLSVHLKGDPNISL